jgi:hypothetical protein
VLEQVLVLYCTVTTVRTSHYCTSCLRQSSWSSRPRLLASSTPPAARAVFPDLRFSCAGLDLLWPRRSSVASPVESESSASSNRRTAMQGREDRETRNSGLRACKISCLGQKCRDVRARALTYRDTCRVEDRMDKSMFRREERGRGTEEALHVMYALMHRRGGWYIAASYYSHIKDGDDCRCRTRGCGVKGINGAG